MMECSMGPRQISGLSPGFKNPTEMTLSPWASSGSIRLSPSTLGCALMPSIRGTLGPYTSASSNPTLYPSLDNPIARLTASVVFPTPPLPEPTAMIAPTPGRGWGDGGCCCCPGRGETGDLIGRLYVSALQQFAIGTWPFIRNHW